MRYGGVWRYGVKGILAAPEVSRLRVHTLDGPWEEGPKGETEPSSSSALGLGSAWERPQKAKGYTKEEQPAPGGLRREEGLEPTFSHHPLCPSKPLAADQEGP